jgi:hypothetical protein
VEHSLKRSWEGSPVRVEKHPQAVPRRTEQWEAEFERMQEEVGCTHSKGAECKRLKGEESRGFAEACPLVLCSEKVGRIAR